LESSHCRLCNAEHCFGSVPAFSGQAGVRGGILSNALDANSQIDIFIKNQYIIFYVEVFACAQQKMVSRAF